MENQKIKHFNERSLISWFLPKLSKLKTTSFLVGPGDDAAVLKKPAGLILSIDSLTDGIHFQMNWAQTLKKRFGLSLGEALGTKAMSSALSDLAAMGDVRNRWALVYLGFPKKISPRFLMDFHKGIQRSSKTYKTAVVGGDTTRSKTVTISVAVGGTLLSRPLRRKKAKKGDYLCVAGNIGDASLGLSVLQNKKKIGSKKDASHFVRQFFEPSALFEEGRILSQYKEVTSALDLSDSLHESIQLLLPKGMNVKVNLESIPISNHYYRWMPRTSKLLSQGEDYGLLFTVSPRKIGFLRKKIKFSILGQITQGRKGISYFSKGKPIVTPPVFRHF